MFRRHAARPALIDPRRTHLLGSPARMTPDVDPLDLVDPARYARDGYPHAVWTRLRAEVPVALISPPGYEPFWAITKHADIVQVSKQPLRFSNAQGIMLR